MDLKDYSVASLSELTASSSPAPGGGSISAMAGAFGAALVSMAAALTIGKKGYEAVAGRMEELRARAELLRLELLDDIQRDTSSFDAFMAALALPKGTQEEKAARSLAMQEALKGACKVPHEVSVKAFEVLLMAQEALTTANSNVQSDCLVGFEMARTAVLGALGNVRINLPGIRDERFVSSMTAYCEGVEEKVEALGQRVSEALGRRV